MAPRVQLRQRRRAESLLRRADEVHPFPQPARRRPDRALGAGRRHPLAPRRILLAAVLRNLSLEKVPLFPPTATAGLAWGSDTDWHIAFDYKADLSDLHDVKHRAALGAELLLEQSFALRGGASWDPAASLWWISAGLGILTEKGGLQLVWRRRVSGGYDQFFEGGLTIYLE